MVILFHMIDLPTANATFCHPVLDTGSRYGEYHP
jgi:hypothetical protein